MNIQIKTILFPLFVFMTGTTAYAHDFEAQNADGVTIYYNYINDGAELEVTNCYYYYSGAVNIPEEVTFMNRTRKVTSIGKEAFSGCSGLTFITIPNSVTTIGEWAFSHCSGLTTITIPNSVTSIGKLAFWDCSGLTSITIPNSVTRIEEGAFSGCFGLTSITIPISVTWIGQGAFYGIDLSSVISKIEKPFGINGKSGSSRTFTNNTFNNATLYVPVGTKEKYKATAGWKDFLYIEEGDGPNGSGGDSPETKKCTIPTIGYQNGKLTFNCDTEGATCQYTITDSDIKSGSCNEVQLGVTYNISVYANKSGYENSETATATLCWIDVEPKTEGIVNGVVSVRATAVLIQSNGSALTVSGADDGTPINVYSVNGSQAGSAISQNGSASINTSLQPGCIAIVKVGDKSVKVLLKK